MKSKRSRIEAKSARNRSPGRPRSHRGPECRPRAPGSAPRGASSGPKGALEGPQGDPKSGQGRPKSAQREPKGSQEGPEERQNRPQVGISREKIQICGKCSATRPCRRSRHFATPQLDPESPKNRPKSVPRAPRGASSIDFGRSKVPQAASARDLGRVGPPWAPQGVACRARPFAHSLVPYRQFE